MADRLHTVWSAPGDHRVRLSDLPIEPERLADALEEFVIHHAVARQLGFEVPERAETHRGLRRVALLLDEAMARDPRPLSDHRDLPDYLYVTCRDFAMLAVSTFREAGIPARLRAGFASYFSPGRWEDHYVCEYRDGEDWAVLDAQLGRRARTGMGIRFDVGHVPDTAWLPAGAVWRAVRSGTMDAATCGLSGAGIAGEWWIAGSVLRDAASLAGRECLPWDDWGPAVEFRAEGAVTFDQASAMDALAQAIEPAPRDRSEAEDVLARFPWAAPELGG